MDHQRLAAQIPQLRDGGAQGGLVKRRQDAAPGIHPLGDFQPQVARDHRREMAVHPVGLRTGAAAKLQHVAESGRGDETGFRKLALQHRVGRGGRAVDDQVDLRQIGTRRVEGRQHAARLVRQSGRDLGQPDLPGRRIEDREVREGAAHVDTCDKARHACPRRSALRVIHTPT